MKVLPPSNPVAVILAVFQVMIGSLYLFAAAAGAFSRTTPEYQFLVGFGSIATAWGLLQCKSWTLAAQFIVMVALAFMWRGFDDHGYMAPARNIYDSIEQFMSVVPAFILGLATSAMLVIRWRVKPKSERATSSRGRIFEWSALLALVLAAILGDFVVPAMFADRERNHAIAQQQELELLQESQSVAQSQLVQIFQDLEVAIRNDDSEKEASLLAQIISLRDAAGYGGWREALAAAPRNVQLKLLNEAATERLDASDFAAVLTDENMDPVVRRRATIALMKTPGKGTVRRMGSLKYLIHRHAVDLLADAISDQRHTTVEERIALAHALEETARLPDYDIESAIPVLRTVIESDDHASVRQAAAIALEASARSATQSP